MIKIVFHYVLRYREQQSEDIYLANCASEIINVFVDVRSIHSTVSFGDLVLNVCLIYYDSKK